MELSALERLKIAPKTFNWGKMVSPLFLGCSTWLRDVSRKNGYPQDGSLTTFFFYPILLIFAGNEKMH